MKRIRRFNESNKLDPSYYSLGSYDWFLNNSNLDASKIENCLQQLIDDNIKFDISLSDEQEDVVIKFTTDFRTGTTRTTDPLRDFSRLLEQISYPIDDISKLEYFKSHQIFIYSEYGHHIIEVVFNLHDDYIDSEDELDYPSTKPWITP